MRRGIRTLSGSCWCAAEPITLPVPADSSEDCLCRQCLRQRAGTKAAAAFGDTI